MNQIKTKFKGLFIIHNERLLDNRGYFEKKYISEFFIKIIPQVRESYTSFSNMGVLRGLHYQTGGFAQTKLITCLSGSFMDIAVDLRKKEKTFGQVFIQKIDSKMGISVFIPGQFAHGIYALENNTILLNYSGEKYSQGNEGGILWSSIKELSFIKNPEISDKDRLLPSLDEVLCKIKE